MISVYLIRVILKVLYMITLLCIEVISACVIPPVGQQLSRTTVAVHVLSTDKIVGFAFCSLGTYNYVFNAYTYA